MELKNTLPSQLVVVVLPLGKVIGTEEIDTTLNKKSLRPVICLEAPESRIQEVIPKKLS